MLKNYTNLENYVKFFKYIIEINKNREKEGRKKIYMIFIFNQGNQSSEISLLEFLKDKNLNDLIEKIEEKKEGNKLSFKDKYKNKNSNKGEKKTKYNIVLLNLLKDENFENNVYGIDELLKLTLYFLRKHNPLSKDKLNSLLDYKQRLIKPDINKNERNEIEKQVKDIYKTLSNENTFLSNIESFDSIIANAHFNNAIFRLSHLFFYSQFFFRNSKANEYLFVFKKIQQNYKIYTDEIMIKPRLGNNNKILGGFDFVKSSNEDVQSKKEILDKQKLLEESPDSIKINKGFYINKDYYEYIACFPDFFGKSFYDVVVNYFDNYLKETYCIEYVCKQMEIYDNIFNQLEKMSKKNDWNKFHPQIFK